MANNIFLNFLSMVRYWVWQNAHLQPVIVTLVVLYILTSVQSFYFFGLFILYLIFSYTYGYTLNSFFDRSLDLQVGKDQYAGFSEDFVKVVIVFSGILSLVVLFLFQNKFILLLGVAVLILATFYSVPPFRFKERAIGVFTATITHKLPFLFFVFLFPENSKILWFLFGWLVIHGLLVEMVHLLYDYKKDLSLGIKTFAVSIGINRSKFMLRSTAYVLLMYLLIGVVLHEAVFVADFNLFVFSIFILFMFSHEPIKTGLHYAALIED